MKCWLAGWRPGGRKVLSGPERIIQMHIKFPVNLPVISESLGRLMSWHTPQNGDGLSPKDESPFRGDLFSVDQLERHAKALAASHQLASGRAGDTRILDKNDKNEWCKGTCSVAGGDASARDHLWLTEAEWKQLILPDPKAGDKFALPAGVAQRIARFQMRARAGRRWESSLSWRKVNPGPTGCRRKVPARSASISVANEPQFREVHDDLVWPMARAAGSRGDADRGSGRH